MTTESLWTQFGKFCLRLFFATTTTFGSAQGAIAACNTASCDDVRILTFYTPVSGDTYFQLSGTPSNLSCSLVSGAYVTLVNGTDHYKEIYATLLGALLAERSVSVRINTGSAGCTIMYVVVNGT